MGNSNLNQLEKAIDEITILANDMGLDFFPMRYEVCPADIIYSIGAYGMPTRFSHWSFGKSFQRMKMDYDYGLSKIYELVINSDPCYAFLLDSNSLLQNKLIVTHVLGHSDFFKNNAYFSPTNRNMVESMAVSARRIGQLEYHYGIDDVESWLDAILAVQEHIDPRNRVKDEFTREKDLLLYIAENSRHLEEWQSELIYMMREEMLYFWPQMETKIMNEGWASLWHMKIMRELDLTEDETIEFARMNSSVLQPQPTGINPYYLGVKMFEYLEKERGLDFIMEVRTFDNDVSFLRNYLSKELIEDMDLYLYGKQGSDYKVTDKDWEKVKEQLIVSRINGGSPVILVKDGDYNKNGELYLLHRYEGIELDEKYVKKTLPYVYQLWGRPVHLETVVEGNSRCYECDDKDHIEINYKK